MNANQLAATLSKFESQVRQGLFADAKKDLNEILAIVEATSLPQLKASTFVSLARSLRELAEYEALVLEKAECYAHAQDVLTKATTLYPLAAGKDVMGAIGLTCEQGRLYFSQSKFGKAISEFGRVISQGEASSGQRRLAYQWTIASLRRKFRPIEAEQMLEQAASLFGGDASEVVVESAWLAHDNQNYVKALNGFALVLAGKPDNEWALIGQLCCLYSLDDKKAADQCIEELRKRVPPNRLSDCRILVMLGKCSEILDSFCRYPAELMVYGQMVDLDSGNAYLLEEKIANLRELRRYSEAEKLCRESQKKFPGHAGLQMALGFVYYHQLRYQESYDQLKCELLKDDETALEWVLTVLRRLNRNDEAAKEVDKALARFPESAGFLEEKAALYFAERRYQDAIEIFDRALKIDGERLFALQWKIASLRKLGRFGCATELAEEAIQLLPRSAFLYGERGWLFFDQNKLEEAEASFLKATKLNPYLVHLAFARVEVLVRLGRAREGRDILDDLNRRFPNDEEIEERLGWFCLGQNKPFDAAKVFRTILERNPASVVGINGLGGFFLDRQDYGSAEAQFRKAISQVDYEPQYHVNLAWALVRQASEVSPIVRAKRQPQDMETLLSAAEDSCLTALKHDRFNSKAMECLGVIAFKRGRFVEAEDYFASSVRTDPQQGSHVDLGALYTQMGRYDDAAASLTAALKLNKNDTRALVELANLLLAKGESGSSIAACQQAALVDPGNDECHRALAITLMRTGQFTEAERVLRDAIQRLDDARRWRLHLILSQVLVRLGDDNNKDRALYDEALRHVNAARRTKGTHEEIHFYAGIVYSRLQDYVAARRSFAACLKSNPKRFDAERNVALAQQRIREEKNVNRINILGGLIMAVVCFLGLVGLWGLFLSGWGGKVDPPLITFMTPLLLGLTIVALLLPNLNKLKLPGGFEAEISEPKPKDISSGPKGEIGFGSSQEAISPGPR